jgi:hypothetical protein
MIAISLLLSFALTTGGLKPLPVCEEDDLTCLRRSLFVRATEAESLAIELAAKDRLVMTLQEENTIKTASLEALRGEAGRITALRIQWFESPTFLIPVGVVTGVLLTVLAGWAIGQAAR